MGPPVAARERAGVTTLLIGLIALAALLAPIASAGGYKP
jgi:hypothetical protein